MFTYRNVIAARQSGFSWARLRAIVWDRRCLPSRVYSRVLQTVTVICARVSPTLVRARSACKLTPTDSVTLASPDVSPTRRAFIFSFVHAFSCYVFHLFDQEESANRRDLRSTGYPRLEFHSVPNERRSSACSE